MAGIAAVLCALALTLRALRCEARGDESTVLRAWTWAAVATFLGRTRTPLHALGVAGLLLVLQAPERREDEHRRILERQTLRCTGRRRQGRGGEGRRRSWGIIVAGGRGTCASYPHPGSGPDERRIIEP